MLERASAIESGRARGGRTPTGDVGVRIGELRGWSLLQVAGFAGTRTRVDEAVSAAYRISVPDRIGAAVRAGALLLMRTGPEQLWIIGPGDPMAAEGVLRGDIAPGMGGVVSLSHSRTRLVLEGRKARDVLAKGFPIDLHPDVFGIDQFALTGLDHTPVLLLRSGPDRYELLAMRTFALTIWDWLTDAALEYGYEVSA